VLLGERVVVSNLPGQKAAAFDIAIIGGGVNGCGIARDAAGRGASVLLLEQGDLGGGTSSASTKLIHGGLRYLEHYQFALVREALTERETLWRIAPHIIRPMRFVLPHRSGLRPRWMLRAGLWLYDHIGGRKLLPPTRTINLRNHAAGAPLKPGFVHGWEYSDAWVDDARLVVLNARAAADHGATIMPRTRLVSAAREASGWSIDAEASDGGTHNFHARVLVNAAGPGVMDVLALGAVSSADRIRLVRGSHIIVPRLFDHSFSYFFQLPDGRILFAIPYEEGFTMIGTTDRDHQKADPIEASEEEIAYLCAGVSDYFATPVTPADVVWSFAGVRPLIASDGKPEAASRGYRLQLDGGKDGMAPLLSVFGGKITTFRHLAQDAVDRLETFFPGLPWRPWTADTPLPGGDFAADKRVALIAQLNAEFPFLSSEDSARVVTAYGTRAREWLHFADKGRRFGPLFAAEVDHAIEHEWAMNAEDMMWRRSKAGLRMSPNEQAALNNYMQERLGK
jgi:glycerol-3-phosphate dehydrogenase